MSTCVRAARNARDRRPRLRARAWAPVVLRGAPCLQWPVAEHELIRRSYSRDVRGRTLCLQINWKHGVNALPPAEHDGPGRVSIILWGNAKQAIEEAGSPPLVVNNHGPSQHGAPHGGGGGHGGRGAR